MASDWDKNRIRKEIEDSKEEFFDLTKQLMDIVVKFCLRALKTFEVAKGEELNHIQINQIATKEVEAVIEQISNPEFVSLAAKKAEINYLQENR
jgi:hypothetical protein